MDQRTLVRTVLLAQASDRDALRRLFAATDESLRTRVSAIVGEADGSEDVLQEVFIQIWRKIGHLREPAHFRAWALRIATRAAVRYVEREARLLRVPAALVQDLAAAEEPDPGLSEAEVAFLRELIHTLPPGSRSVMLLHYSDGLTLAEVSSSLGIPLGTVKSRLSYGLNALRARIGGAAQARNRS